MVILTSFFQIIEVDTEMKTAQRDQVNEEKYKPDMIIFVRFYSGFYYFNKTYNIIMYITLY